MRWLIRHRDAITDEESDRILSWAMHEYTEAERLRMQQFSWKGRHVRTVIERSGQYHAGIERPSSNYKWQGHDLSWVVDDPLFDGWSFVELTSGQDLFLEGQAMGHCVAGYAALCSSGRSAIVSMRYHDARRLTVEVTPKTRQIIQARGPGNRGATSEERSVISLWMKTVHERDTSGQPR